MKRFIFLGVFVLMLAACSTHKPVAKHTFSPVKDHADTTTYELIVIDPQFDTWYILHYSEAKDYTDAYYHGKNIMAVVNWNTYYRDGKYRNVVDSNIDYQPQIEYGIEVNRKLYWYFLYVQQEYGIPLMIPGGES